MVSRQCRYVLLLVCEVVLLTFLLLLFPMKASAVVGDPNATAITHMSIENTPPNVINVSIEADSSVVLLPNTTKTVSCVVVIEDFDGDTDIQLANATFYDSLVSFSEDSDDNNYHYSNASCTLNSSYGTFNGYADDEYRAIANCTFDVHYYANPVQWFCNATAEDLSLARGQNVGRENISQLLAIGIPDTLDFGLVNATDISIENFTNITNYGNTVLNLSLSGYARSVGDGNAMNCTQGSTLNISIEHQKYNLTASNTSTITLAQADTIYVNLTSSVTVRYFNLTARTNDAENDVWKPAYWRMYLPLGVAGNCSGNTVIGATTAAGT